MKKWYAIVGIWLLAATAVLVFTGCELFGAQPNISVEWVDKGGVGPESVVDCGALTLNKSEPFEFEIINEGNWTFTLQDIKSSNPDKFEIVQDGVGQVGPGVSESFSVFFKPPGAGSYETEISIHFKNADPYTFRMEGTGVEPDFKIWDPNDITFESGSNYSLGVYNQNDSASAIQSQITNVGDGTLEITGTNEDPTGLLDSSIADTTLEPGESTTLDVTPHTDTTGDPINVTYTISTNDPKDEEFIIYFYWSVF